MTDRTLESHAILYMYSIKDDIAKHFSTPEGYISEDLAKREFNNKLIMSPQMAINRNDFSLWYIGKYDPNTAQFEPATPEVIERG